MSNIQSLIGTQPTHKARGLRLKIRPMTASITDQQEQRQEEKQSQRRVQPLRMNRGSRMASALQHMEVDDDAMTSLPRRKRNRQVAEETEELADVPENTAINPLAPSSKKRKQEALPPSMPVPPPMPLHPPVPIQAWPERTHTEIPSNCTGISVGVASSPSLAALAPIPVSPAPVPPTRAPVPPAHDPVPPARAPVPPPAPVPPAPAEKSRFLIGPPDDHEHENDRSSDENDGYSDETNRNWHENERNSDVNDRDDFYAEEEGEFMRESGYLLGDSRG